MSIEDKLDAAIEKHKAGNVQEAVGVYQAILKEDPKNADALHYFGLAHLGAGQFDKAIDLIRLSLTYNPDNPKAWSNLGSAYQNNQQLDDAIEALERACILDPNFHTAHYNLGAIYLAQNKLEQAENPLIKAIELDPGNVDAICNLGSLYQHQEKFDKAQIQYQKAMQTNPNHPIAITNAGISAYLDDKFEQAKNLLDKALSITPDFHVALFHRALIHEHAGEMDMAISLHKKAIAIKPDYAEPHFNIGFHQLMNGDFKNGWQNYEWRLKRQSYKAQLEMNHLPRWQGEILTNKSLLVYSEQGFGDSIQVLRFLPYVKERCPNVSLAIQPALIRLFTPFCAKHDITLIANNSAIPETDYQIPMMSLPMVFKTDLSNIPSDTPYLSIDDETAKKWHTAYKPDAKKLNVGITWKGSDNKQLDKGRSFPLAMYKKLLDANPHIQFVSLQVGPGLEEISGMSDDLPLTTLALEDFTDTACVIEKLDLVIACDSSVAHLTGALNKPVWLVCKKRSEWRWMLGRTDSPWYPSMRIFRPKQDGWDDVFDDMAAAVSNM